MGRTVIFIAAMLFGSSVFGQSKLHHTIELNLFNIISSSAEVHYSLHSQSKIGLRAEVAYTFNRGTMFTNLSRRNLEEMIISGYMFKAGPEIGIFENDIKRVSIALMPFYGIGRIQNHIRINYPLGTYRNREDFGYMVYGGTLHVGVLVWENNNFFFQTALEQSVAVFNGRGNPVSPADVPGLGILYWGNNNLPHLALRFTGTLGYSF